MIASYSCNLIFLKTRKTAGTSVEIVLSTWCSQKDVVTPFVVAADEDTRRRLGGQPANYERGWFRPPFRNHDAAVDVKRRLPGLWNSAFKFAVERHPYERVVSRAYWWLHLRGGDPQTDFGESLEQALSAHDISNRPIYCIDDKVAVDEVILYDDLWPRMAEIAAKFGRTLPAEQPRAKGSYRIDRRPAVEILTDAQKQRVYELTPKDFEEFGFER